MKRIRTQPDIARFKASHSHKCLVRFISELASSVQGVANDHRPSLESVSPCIARTVGLLESVDGWIDDIPLEDMATTRFGNKSARVWHQRLRDAAVGTLVPPLLVDPQGRLPDGLADAAAKQAATEELAGYLVDSFGNATRLDYGSGHELHFLLFFFGLAHRGALALPPPLRPLRADSDAESVSDAAMADRQALVLHVFARYLQLMRRLQSHYRLEPAGSHGVWGLDDYHHLPFIFGAAQLSAAPIDPAQPTEVQPDSPATVARPSAVAAPAAPAPPTDVASPGCITEAGPVRAFASQYMYLGMVAWILGNKKGPFHEHSSVLYNVSGVPTWSKIVVGMFKMYEGEVLAKINITQHLLFGAAFPWPEDSSPAMPPPTAVPPHAAGPAVQPANEAPK